ncbi:ferrous iron transport protein A [uncultured Gammaproteobacteria bacterium]
MSKDRSTNAARLVRAPTQRLSAQRLSTLGRGEQVTVIGIDETDVASSLPPGELERRLIEMGLVEGASVVAMHEGFPGRDPIAIRVNDHKIALRRAEAHAVLVVPRA